MKRSSLIAISLALPAALVLLASALSTQAAQPTKRKPDPERGKELYERSCWMCHGRTGLGDGPAASALTVPVPPLPGGIDPADVEPHVPLIQNGRGPMPAFNENIDLRDTRRLLGYLTTLDDPPPPEDPDKKTGETVTDRDKDEQDAAPE